MLLDHATALDTPSPSANLEDKVMSRSVGAPVELMRDRVLEEAEEEEEEERCLVIHVQNAPIYAFDEDGDILPCSTALLPPIRYHLEPPARTPEDDVRETGKTEESRISHLKEEVQETISKPRPTHLEEEVQKAISRSFPTQLKEDLRKTTSRCRPAELHFENSVEDHKASTAPILYIEDDGGEARDGKAATLVPPREATRHNKVPTIDLHAASIEVVEDYLEDDLDDRPSGGGRGGPRPLQDSLMTYLSAGDGTTPRRPRVPFHTVVFTERKHSTGDALIRSLGLGSPGATTSIQDITSVNQDAARERLHSGDVLRQHQCTSCGVSPEECLEKLGLHPVPASTSTKNERLQHFLQQVQAKLSRPSPPSDDHPRPRIPSCSDPILDVSSEPPSAALRPQHRSLANSPALSQEDDFVF